MIKTGRILVSVAALSVPLVQWPVDFNSSHAFNPEWPPHARFHEVVLLLFGTGMAVVALWLIWGRTKDPDTHMKVATLVPILAWGTFFIAILVPGTGFDDYPEATPTIPPNLIVAGLFSSLSAAGYALYVRGCKKKP